MRKISILALFVLTSTLCVTAQATQGQSTTSGSSSSKSLQNISKHEALHKARVQTALRKVKKRVMVADASSDNSQVYQEYSSATKPPRKTLDTGKSNGLVDTSNLTHKPKIDSNTEFIANLPESSTQPISDKDEE